MAGDSKPRFRKTRVALVVLGALVVVFLLAWQNYWARHKILRVVTGVEDVSLWMLGEPAAPGETTFYLHRAQSQPELPGAPVEIDVCFTSDFVPFLSHGDDHFGATPQSLEFQQLSAADVESTTRADGSKFVKLADYLPGPSRIILDIKTDHADAAAKAEALAGLMTDPDKFIITSLSGRFLFELRDRVPGLRVGCESFGPLASWLAGFDGYHARLSEVADANDEAARALGLRRLYFVAGTSEEMQRANELSPEGLIVKREAGPWK